MEIRNYNFDKTEVTSLLIDDNYIWIAFKSSSGTSTLRKVSSFDLTQVYYEFNIPVDEITNMKIVGTNIYLSFDDDTYIGGYYNRTNPLTLNGYLSKPESIVEKSIDVVSDGTYIFFLIPGIESGTNTKVLKYTTSILNDTIDLITINNAVSMTIDTNDNIWIVTNEDPSKLVKVYIESGDSYGYSKWNIE